MSGTGLGVLVAAVLATLLVAGWLRTRDGRIRRTSGQEPTVTQPEQPGTPGSVFADLGIDPGAADLTVVQFSTAFCAPCRQTKARLEQLQTSRPGLAYVHVDAESHLDEVRALDVRRTPTLFYLDRSGALLGRSSGAPRPAELTALVDAHAPVAGRS